jgi:hypothetical protein
MSEWLWRGYARCLRRIAFGDIPAVHDSRYRTNEGRLGNYSGASPSWARDRPGSQEPPGIRTPPNTDALCVESWVHKSTTMAVCLSSFRVCRRRIDGGYCRLMRVTLKTIKRNSPTKLAGLQTAVHPRQRGARCGSLTPDASNDWSGWITSAVSQCARGAKPMFEAHKWTCVFWAAADQEPAVHIYDPARA